MNLSIRCCRKSRWMLLWGSRTKTLKNSLKGTSHWSSLDTLQQKTCSIISRLFFGNWICLTWYKLPWMVPLQTGNFWKFSRRAIESDPDMPGLIEVWSCGLHVVHGAYKYGATATGCNLDSLLRSLFWLFEDSPAKQDYYTTKTFPLRLYSTTWIENVPVAEHALLLWPNVQKYVQETLAGLNLSYSSMSKTMYRIH